VDANPRTSATKAMVQHIFQMSLPKGRRIHHAVEVFQKRNPKIIQAALAREGYDSILTSSVLSESGDPEDPEKRLKRIREERMRLRRRVINALWLEASAEE
jgi:hypothetical protein